MIPAALTALFWSLSAITANQSVRQLGSNRANFYRLAVACVILGFWAHTGGKGFGGASMGFFLLSGLIGFGFGDVGVFQALPRIGSRLTLLFTQCLAAPIAGLAEWLWLGTTLGGWQVLWGACILTGVGLALSPREVPPAARRTLWVGSAFGVLAALGQGLGAVCSRKAYEVARMAGEQVDAGTAAYERILGGIVIALLMLVLLPSRSVGEVAGQGPRRKARTLFFVLANSLSGPVIGVSCYQWALSGTPSAVVLPIVALTPIVAIPFARLLENDRPSARSLAGGALAVGAAAALAYVTAR